MEGVEGGVPWQRYRAPGLLLGWGPATGWRDRVFRYTTSVLPRWPTFGQSRIGRVTGGYLEVTCSVSGVSARNRVSQQ